MTTRTITGTLHHLPDTPWAAAELTFRLMTAFADADTTFPTETITVTTDEDGAFSQALAVPDAPDTAARYRCDLPNGAAFLFNLADGESAVTLESLVVLALTTADPNSVLTLIEAHTLNTTTAHGGIVKPPLAMSFSGNGDIYFVAHEAMTLTAPIEAGTGTLAYTRALAAAPTSFSTLTFPGALATGDILKVTLTDISGYKAATLPRSA